MKLAAFSGVRFEHRSIRKRARRNMLRASDLSSMKRVDVAKDRARPSARRNSKVCVVRLVGIAPRDAIEILGQRHDPAAQRCIEDLQAVVGDHEHGHILHIVHVAGAMQVDEVDPFFHRVIDDVVDIEVAMDIDREGGLEGLFVITGLFHQ